MSFSPDLRALLEPRSIAIVGASDRPGPSTRIFASLTAMGFSGEIFAVNPGREQALGRPCVPSLTALSTPPDAAVLCIGPERVTDAVIDAAAAGVKAVVSFASGVQRMVHDGRPAIEVIQQACVNANIAFCGPDCMGVLNAACGSTLYLGELLEPASIRGDVGLITQSGSMAIGLLTDCRRFGYSHVISTGAEAVLDAAHYLSALADDTDTKVIALFLEAVRDMDRFLAALTRARGAGKPVVVLKVGKTEASRQAALGHTGGIAGDARVFSALLRRHGGIEVATLEELTETIVCLRAARRPAKRGIGIVSPSGGHVEYALDTAARAAIALPPMPESARAELATIIGPMIGPGNPVDAWGNGDFERNLRAGLAAFAGSDEYGAVALITDTMDGQPTRPSHYVDALLDIAATCDKPFYLLSSRAGLFRRDFADRLAANGAAQLSGIEPALRAISKVAGWCGAVALPPGKPGSASGPEVVRVPGSGWLNEAAAKAFLAARGFTVAPGTVVSAADDLVEAAAAVGFPVALKVIDDRIPHRTPYGLIALDLADAAAVRDGGTLLRERLVRHAPDCADAPFLVERMTPSGLDLFVAASTDPECGPMVLLGLGGFLLEAVRDVVAVPLPACAGEVAALLQESAIGRFLASPSGATFGGVEPLVSFAEAIGELYIAAAGGLSLIEINPVRLVPGQGAPVILDALIASREQMP